MYKRPDDYDESRIIRPFFPRSRVLWRRGYKTSGDRAAMFECRGPAVLRYYSHRERGIITYNTTYTIYSLTPYTFSVADTIF